MAHPPSAYRLHRPMRAGSGTHHLHGRPHRVQKEDFCLRWHWSTFSPTSNTTPYALSTRSPPLQTLWMSQANMATPKNISKFWQKNSLYLPHFSLSFLPHMDQFLLNNKPSRGIPVAGIHFQLDGHFSSHCSSGSVFPFSPEPARSVSGCTTALWVGTGLQHLHPGCKPARQWSKVSYKVQVMPG